MSEPVDPGEVITTVKMTMGTRDALKKMKRGGETYDTLINRLMGEER